MRREIGSEGTWRGREIGWMRDEGGERVDERQKGGRICQEDRNYSLSVSGWVNLTVLLSIMNKSSMVIASISCQRTRSKAEQELTMH